ncbi:MAG: LysR family transcriptional regulator [Propionibacteriaceae bacterium]|nr:LysR family transcriptional regulator [Propionibacteriaceae bacterium]
MKTGTDMNMRQLQYILRIAQEGSVTGAAASLHISQPSLSALLASVEKEMGAKLFDRSVTPLALTQAGEKYVTAAERIISVYSDLQHEIDDLNDPGAGFLNVGCGPQHSPFVIPTVLSPLMKRYPKARFNLVEDFKAALEERLLKGSLDVIICSELKPHPNILSHTLTNEEVVLLAWHDFESQTAEPAAGRLFPVIDPRELIDRPFVLMKRGHNLRVLQDLVLERIGLAPHPMLETDSWQTCLRLAQTAMAFTILPYSDPAPGGETVRKLSLPYPLFRHTVVCRRKNSFSSVLLDDFIETAQATF